MRRHKMSPSTENENAREGGKSSQLRRQAMTDGGASERQRRDRKFTSQPNGVSKVNKEKEENSRIPTCIDTTTTPELHNPLLLYHMPKSLLRLAIMCLPLLIKHPPILLLYQERKRHSNFGGSV
jgi:hypothetical protein